MTVLQQQQPEFTEFFTPLELLQFLFNLMHNAILLYQKDSVLLQQESIVQQKLQFTISFKSFSVIKCGSVNLMNSLCTFKHDDWKLITMHEARNLDKVCTKAEQFAK